MSQANPLWGAPRIHGELQKLGIAFSQSTVAKYMVRCRRPPSQTWRTFLANHVGQVMAAVWQIIVSGNRQQQAEAAEILAETRRKLYGLLADGDPE